MNRVTLRLEEIDFKKICVVDNNINYETIDGPRFFDIELPVLGQPSFCWSNPPEQESHVVRRHYMSTLLVVEILPERVIPSKRANIVEKYNNVSPTTTRRQHYEGKRPKMRERKSNNQKRQLYGFVKQRQ